MTNSSSTARGVVPGRIAPQTLVLVGSVVAVLGLVILYFVLTTNTVTLVNASSGSLANASVVVGGRTIIKTSLAAGEQVTAHFRVPHESSYTVSGMYEDGRQIHANFGYVSPLIDGKYVITVQATRVVYSAGAGDESVAD